VPRVRDLLYRFRPSGAPGTAARPGVPADRARDLADELEPVFSALAPTVAQCRAVVSAGRSRADTVRQSYVSEVERLLSTSAERTAAERARATAAAYAAGLPDMGQLDAASEAHIAQIDDLVQGALPRYRDEVIASVLALLGETP
jgi:hypothetical protein